jgi:hypothetical protein
LNVISIAADEVAPLIDVVSMAESPVSSTLFAAVPARACLFLAKE